MTPPDMVLFDCDGVLVDSEPISERVIRADLAQFNLDVSAEQFRDFFLGGTLAGVAEKARSLGAPLPETWVDDIYAKMFKVLAAEVAEVEGIRDVLDALDGAHIPYAVASNGPHRKMEITLGRTGLMSRFAGRIYSREDVAKPKPAPDVYLKAAYDAGIAPERSAVVEDSANGARAGRAAGMMVLGYAGDTPAERLSPVCHHVFDDMRDLPRLLGLAQAG